jgi:hypothetical protein
VAASPTTKKDRTKGTNSLGWLIAALSPTPAKIPHNKSTPFALHLETNPSRGAPHVICASINPPVVADRFLINSLLQYQVFGKEKKTNKKDLTCPLFDHN